MHVYLIRNDRLVLLRFSSMIAVFILFFHFVYGISFIMYVII